MLAAVAGALIGAVSLSGSLIAFQGHDVVLHHQREKRADVAGIKLARILVRARSRPCLGRPRPRQLPLRVRRR